MKKAAWYIKIAIGIVVCIVLPAAGAATLFGAICSGMLGALALVLILAIPDFIILVFFPINHPWRIAAKHRYR
ncbi:MAG: hypothetical protein VB042_08740 [Victivallaceae bacterium]|nr:hypothetical protein [Victivallaceae bacterium]